MKSGIAGSSHCPFQRLGPFATVLLGDRTAAVPLDEIRDLGVHPNIARLQLPAVPPAVFEPNVVIDG